MAQSSISYAQKDELGVAPTGVVAASDLNSIKAVVNGNSGDSEGRLVALELSDADTVVMVKQASDLSGILLSTSVYFIDGIIDMGTQSIEVPAGGLSIVGSSFDISQLVSSEDGYTMFTSPAGGSGNLLQQDIGLTTSGVGSQVHNLVSATGFDAFEVARVNWNNCTSMGTLDNFRQGFETGTGRFGGSPILILKGAWSGGYFQDSSIVRSLTDFTGALFEAGANFTMASRFRTNANVDLPASAALLDFSEINFPNSSTVQLVDCIVTRDGVFNPEDTNLTPNLGRGNLASSWRDNTGVPNTFVGATSTLTVESATTINTQGVWESLSGTFAATDLQHFDSAVSGQLRHLGSTPRDFNVVANIVLEGAANDSTSIKFRKWDNSASAFVELEATTQTRVVNNLQGGRNVAYFTVMSSVTLDELDYIYLQARNNDSTTNLTAEVSSFFRVQER
jgi:hypothetical protein